MLLALRRKEIIALGRQEFQMIKPQTKDWFLKVAPAASEDFRLRCYFLQHSGSQDAQRERLGSSHQTTLQAIWSQDLKLPLLSCGKLLFHPFIRSAVVRRSCGSNEGLWLQTLICAWWRAAGAGLVAKMMQFTSAPQLDPHQRLFTFVLTKPVAK